MAALSPNKQYSVPTVNADNNAWGSELNATLAQIDLNLGGSQSVNIAAGNVAAGATQAATLITTFTGALTSGQTYTLPAGYGGILIFNNQTTGNFTVNVASAGGGSNVIIPQGTTVAVYTDGTNVVQTATAIVGNATIYSGSLTLNSGNLLLSSGNVTLSSGNLTLTAGNVVVTAGNLDLLNGGLLAASTGAAVTAQVTGIAPAGALNANINEAATQQLANWFVDSVSVGSVTSNGTTTTYGTTSDARLKEATGEFDEAVAGRIVDRLKPRWFRWRDGASKDPEPGFFAQELHRIFPWAVRVGQGRPGTKKFRPWQTDVAKLMPVVIAELQFLRRRVRQLELEAGGRSETQGGSDRKRR